MLQLLAMPFPAATCTQVPHVVDILREGPLGTGNKGRVAEALCHKAEELQVGWRWHPVDWAGLPASMSAGSWHAAANPSGDSTFCPPPPPNPTHTHLTALHLMELRPQRWWLPAMPRAACLSLCWAVWRHTACSTAGDPCWCCTRRSANGA